MATIKPVIPHFKKDGTARVVIRLTHRRTPRQIPTEIYITKADVTAKGKIKSLSIQDSIDAIVKAYRSKLNDYAVAVEQMTPDELVSFITAKQGENEEIDFIAYSRAKIEQMKSSGTGGAKNYDCAINSFCDFLKKESLNINSISAAMLRDYEAYLAKAPSKRYKTKIVPLGGRAASLYISAIGKLIADAKKDFNDEDEDIFRVKCNPFKKYVAPKAAATEKRALDVEALRKIIALDVSDSLKREQLAKDVYLLSFYLVGMNEVDIFTCTAFKDNKITYYRAKTKDRRSDKAELTLELQPEAQEIFDRYKDESEQRVFGFYKMYASVNTFTQAVNKGLKLIGEKVGVERLTFYSARHSWATIATNNCDIDKYLVHTALNHVDRDMKVTDVYIKKDFSQIDRANRKVIDFLKKNI